MKFNCVVVENVVDANVAKIPLVRKSMWVVVALLGNGYANGAVNVGHVVLHTSLIRQMVAAENPPVLVPLVIWRDVLKKLVLLVACVACRVVANIVVALALPS